MVNSKPGSQHFGLRHDVTGSAYKMISMHVAMHSVAGIQIFLFLHCSVGLHALPVASCHKQQYCELGCKFL